ncbi:MAG: hypothetical protein ACQEQ2_10785 [Pseudomonadota bacterium]
MESNELITLVTFLISIAIATLSAWLIRRASPQRRFIWFTGSVVAFILLFGIKFFFVPLLTCLVILYFAKRDGDNPLGDIGIGFVNIFTIAISWCLFGLYILLPVGALYWMFISIQVGSFWMFLVGFIPIAWPIGAYGLIFDMPDWVLDMFT